jgi:hypothetical protein
MSKIDEAELLQAIETIKTCAKIANTVPVDTARDIVNAHSRERTIMPFLNPTHYIQTNRQTEWQGPLLKAFLAFRRELERITKEHGEQDGG